MRFENTRIVIASLIIVALLSACGNKNDVEVVNNEPSVDTVYINGTIPDSIIWSKDADIETCDVPAYLNSRVISKVPNCDIEDDKENNESIINIVKIDWSTVGKNGKVIGDFYYEKPILLADTNAALLINNYFSNEAQGFYDGTNKLSLYNVRGVKAFNKRINIMRDAYGEDDLERSPLKNIAVTKVMLETKEILSVRAITYWAAGGSSCTFYYGSTFNLQTGELLFLNDFVDLDIETFREKLLELIVYELSQTDHDYNYAKIKELYGSMEYDQFEYFYDGSYLYIALNGSIINDGMLLKWNCIFGDDCEAAFEYPKQDDV